MPKRICVVIADHAHDDYLSDLVNGLRVFAPSVEIAIYNSGDPRTLLDHPVSSEVTVLPVSRRLHYAKVTPFFLDMLEWAAGQQYDFVINAETDMAWIQPGFEDFVTAAMSGYDYMAQHFERVTASTSRWRPYRSLRRELPELLELLGISATNKCFSPAQIFSSRYIDTVTSSPLFPRLRDFVMRNQAPDKSFSLQEVLMPSLVDTFSLAAKDYPSHLISVNRYRPYHAAQSVKRARRTPDAYFVHPIRRDHEDAARRLVRELSQTREVSGVPA